MVIWKTPPLSVKPVQRVRPRQIKHRLLEIEMPEALYTVCFTAQHVAYYCVPEHHWYDWFAPSPYQLGWLGLFLGFAFIRGIVQGLVVRWRRKKAITAYYRRWEHIGGYGGESGHIWVEHPVRRRWP